MQTGNFVAKLRLRASGSNTGEERVIAIPLAFLVEGQKQQLTLLD